LFFWKKIYIFANEIIFIDMKIVENITKKECIMELVRTCFVNTRLLKKEDLSREMEKHLPLTVSSFKLEGLNDKQDRLTLCFADGTLNTVVSWRPSSTGTGVVVNSIE
jgi:hypothetical protein